MDRQDDADRTGTAAGSVLTSGPPRYVPKGPWGPIGALVAGTILAVGALVVAVVGGGLLMAHITGVPFDDFGQREFEALGLYISGAWELMLIAGVWSLAGWRGGSRREVLQIDGPKPALGEIALAITGHIVVLGVVLGLLYLYDSEALLANYRSDVAPYLEAMRDANARLIVPMLLVTAIVLAPLSEEFLFRGFLMSGLTKWRWGFWVPAVLSTLIWTVPHGYSVTGTTLVVVYGLYFSWLLWRTGQLWLPLICHAFANVLAMTGIAIYAWS